MFPPPPPDFDRIKQPSSAGVYIMGASQIDSYNNESNQVPVMGAVGLPMAATPVME